MKFFLSIILVIILTVFQGICQNLVPNPSFENMQDCPLEYYNFELVDDWFATTRGTPDIFHACGNNTTGIPDNRWGNQEARTGDAFAGLYTYAVFNDTASAREYMSCKLNETLVIGKKYEFKIHFNKPDVFNWASKDINIYFSENSPETIYGSILGAIPEQPIVSNETTFGLNDGWEELTFIFEADKEYEYLTIGNFKENSETERSQVNNNLSGPGFNGDNAYFYIDDISLEMIEDSVEEDSSNAIEPHFFIPNVFSPDNNGINDLFALRHNESVVDYDIIVHDRFGNIITQVSPGIAWNGKDNLGHTYPSGTYVYQGQIYFLNKEAKRIRGTISLIQ